MQSSKLCLLPSRGQRRAGPALRHAIRRRSPLRRQRKPRYKNYTLPAAPPLHPKHEKLVTAKTGRGRPHQPKKTTAAPVVTRPAKRGKKQQRRQKEREGTDNEASSSEEEGSAVPELVVSLQLQFVFDTIQMQFVFDAIHTTLPSPDLRRGNLATLHLLKRKRTRMTR